MKYLYENYVSLVAVISNDADILIDRIRRLEQVLKENFKYYEFVLDRKSVV